MKHLQLILWGLGSLFLTSAASSDVSDENDIFSDSYGRDIYEASNDFKCPFPFGSFPDRKDCAHFYVCVAGIPVHRKCGLFQHFCILRRKCMPILVAICGTDKTTTTVDVTATTKIGDNFKCPRWTGSFPHPNDCSKYYTCVFYMASLKTCPQKQLFDDVASSCKPETEVDCGTRQRPDYTTVAISTEPVFTEIPEVNSTEEDIAESTIEAIKTTILRPTAEEIVNETISTTTVRPIGPPDHDCDEDDVDCIITETGDAEDWFICSKDIGSFPHPSSDKLFIFCMNWIPSVKKCGMDLVFSEEHSTCI